MRPMPQPSTRRTPRPSEPRADGGDGPTPPLADAEREALLRRLETWIDEEERLIAEIERRIEAAARDLESMPSRTEAARCGRTDDRGRAASQRRMSRSIPRTRQTPAPQAADRP